MASVKMNCPKCCGLGLTGTVVENVCSQCKGIGTITVQDTDTLATISTASATPIIVTKATAVPPVAVKISSRGHD